VPAGLSLLVPPSEPVNFSGPRHFGRLGAVVKMDWEKLVHFLEDFNQRPIGLDQTVHHRDHLGCLEVFRPKAELLRKPLADHSANQNYSA